MAATTVTHLSAISRAIDDEAHYEVVNGQRVAIRAMGSY
jgi:hypothetical protein